MNTVTLTIDGISVTVPSDYTILEAAKEASINIPTLCYLKDLNKIGACRLCLVEVAGARGLLASCITQVADGMVVKTNTRRAAQSAQAESGAAAFQPQPRMYDLRPLAELRASGAPAANWAWMNTPSTARKTSTRWTSSAPPSCATTPNAQLPPLLAACNNMQKIAPSGPPAAAFPPPSLRVRPLARRFALHQLRPVHHRLPGRRAARKEQHQRRLDAAQRPGEGRHRAAGARRPARRWARNSGCRWAPPSPASWLPALRRLGFDKVFDTDFGADLTILEEGTELLNRLNGGGALPMITSCSPGWVKYCETFFPEFIPNLSTCKSPHEMLGAIIKTYYAEKNDIDPRNIFTVSIMPCTAKKYESQREELGP